MQFDSVSAGSGHVFRVERRSGPVWYAKYRPLGGRQVKKKIGPAWIGRGRPAPGTFTKRTAEDWLDDVLAKARERHGAGVVDDNVTFAVAAREWLRYVEHDRGCKPSTMRGYRNSVHAKEQPPRRDRPAGPAVCASVSVAMLASCRRSVASTGS